MPVTKAQQEPGRAYAQLKWKLLVILLMLVGIGVQVWAAGQWAENFDSDEATFGLMARHILRGEWPTFVYGNRYLGSTEAILAAPFLRLFGNHGNHVFVLRLSTIMLFALFLSLHALLVTKWFGRRTALFTLLFLIFPGWRILWWTFRPIGPYISMFVLGTIILLLGTSLLRQPVFRPAGLFLLGLIIGLALWTHQMSIPYVLALGVAFLLQSPEWKVLYAKGAKWGIATFGKAAVLLPLALVFGLSILFTLSLFSDSCSPPQQFALIRTASRLGLAVIAGGLGVALITVSGRRRLFLKGAGIVTAGVMLGIAPLWANALLTGVTPSPALWPSCPTEMPERLRLLARELLPGLFGLPTGTELSNILLPQTVPAAAITLFVGAAVFHFVWQQRRPLASLLTLHPLPRFEPAVIPALLFLIPISLAALGSNSVDALSIRYLLVAWQASAIILGLFVAALSKRAPIVTVALVALYVYQLGIVNLRSAHQFWETRHGRFSTAETVPLEEKLRDLQVTAGYGDYWTVYALDFLLEERMILAPYNGIDRYPPYTAHVAGQPRIALIFPAALLPETVSTIPEMQEVLSGFTGAGPAFPQFHNEIATRRLQERLRVGRWDVWLLEK
jgi:hypothetical protein